MVEAMYSIPEAGGVYRAATRLLVIPMAPPGIQSRTSGILPLRIASGMVPAKIFKPTTALLPAASKSQDS